MSVHWTHFAHTLALRRSHTQTKSYCKSMSVSSSPHLASSSASPSSPHPTASWPPAPPLGVYTLAVSKNKTLPSAASSSPARLLLPALLLARSSSSSSSTCSASFICNIHYMPAKRQRSPAEEGNREVLPSRSHTCNRNRQSKWKGPQQH